AGWQSACEGRTAPSGARRARSSTRRRIWPRVPCGFAQSSSSSPSTADQAVDERRADRQLRCGKRERLARYRLVDAVHLIEDLAGDDLRDVILRVALAVAHPDFRGLLRSGLVGEDPDPGAAG